MSPELTNQSPYLRLAYEAMGRIFASGRVAFTQQDLAREMGRSVTSSLRTALVKMERAGDVQSYKFWTERGGLAKAYWITAANMQLPLDGSDDTQADF